MNYTVPFLVAASVAAPALVFWSRLLRRAPVSTGRLVAALIVVGAACRIVFALWTPAFGAPDEQAHFNYVKYLYEHRSLPVQVSRTDDPSNDWEYYQPPLYYMLCLPLYAATRGVFQAPSPVAAQVLRGVSIGCWAITLWVALRLLRRLGLGDDTTRIVVVAMLACLPTYTFLSAAINNDNLVIALGAVFLYVLAGTPAPGRWAVLGLLLGLALLTKLSAVVYVFAVAALLGARCLYGNLGLARAAASGSICYALAAAVWLPWGIRNNRLYGDLTAETAANISFRWASTGHAVRTIATYMSESFWSVSGIYNNVEFLPQLGIAFGVVAATGLVFLAVSRASGGCLAGDAPAQYLAAMLATIVLNIVLVARFGYLYNQGQGRFLFPMLIPIAVLMALGIQQLAPRAQHERLPGLLGAFFSTYVLSFTAYSLAVFWGAAGPTP